MRYDIAYVDTQIRYRDMKIVEEQLTCRVPTLAIADRLNIAGDAQREGSFERADEIIRQVITELLDEALRARTLIELPIEVLRPLTIRVSEILRKEEIDTVGSLIQRELPAAGHWYNFGPLSRMLLGERMRALGINFAGQRDYAWVRPIRRTSQRIDRLLILPTFRPPSPLELSHVETPLPI